MSFLGLLVDYVVCLSTEPQGSSCPHLSPLLGLQVYASVPGFYWMRALNPRTVLRHTALAYLFS